MDKLVLLLIVLGAACGTLWLAGLLIGTAGLLAWRAGLFTEN